MNSRARNELASIKEELKLIIREMEDISNGVRRDFIGIGNDQCANSIDKVIVQYRNVLRKLDNLDTTTLTESFAKEHGLAFGGKGSMGGR